MADIQHITDHEARALSRVIDQFQESVRFQELIKCCTEPVQELEDSLIDLLVKRSVESAYGQQLDNLGEIVDQPREGRTDEDYRVWIQARVLANRSTGTADDSLEIMQLIESGSVFGLVEHYPASYSLWAYGLQNDPETVLEILHQVKPAGVSFWLEWSDALPGFLFTMGDSSAPVIDPLTGFGDATDPDMGGHMTGVLN